MTLKDLDGDRDPRAVAADWHGGQGSALYAFASTGTVVPGITSEIDRCMRDATAGQRDDLIALRAHVDPLEDAAIEAAEADDDEAAGHVELEPVGDGVARHYIEAAGPEFMPVDAMRADPPRPGEHPMYVRGRRYAAERFDRDSRAYRAAVEAFVAGWDVRDREGSVTR